MELKEKTLVLLYRVYRANSQMNLELHYKYRDYYGVLFSVLTSAFVAGVVQFHNEMFSIALIPIPALMFYLCISGKVTVDRHYRRFLESIVVISKIENMLGVDSSVKFGNRKTERIVWPDDKQFIVDRYYRTMFGTGDSPAERTSTEFIETRMKKGDNTTARHVFTVFQIVSIALLASLAVSLVI